jgi:DNA modification methylase
VSHIRGVVRDCIVEYLQTVRRDARLSEIRRAVAAQVGDVPESSVRSYLNLNVGRLFERTGRGLYRLKDLNGHAVDLSVTYSPAYVEGDTKLFHADCFDWLAAQKPASLHACVTDPPYGLVEYSAKEQAKLHSGNKGGIWRIPPAFDGHQRSPLPRFTVLDEADRKALYAFFKRLGILLNRALVPGGNVVVASNPLLYHIVASAMAEGGLEIRGSIVRLTMTMRGGDRPKNAHEEFSDVSVMPRSMFEPWVLLRRPLDGRVQDNLRAWKTGGFMRPSADRPFGDVIASSPTPKAERAIAPHPSLKPQAFLRQLVRGVLPRGEGIVCDPFAGSGSTLAAAKAVGYSSVGVEVDEKYVELAKTAIPRLSQLTL